MQHVSKDQNNNSRVNLTRNQFKSTKDQLKSNGLNPTLTRFNSFSYNLKAKKNDVPNLFSFDSISTFNRDNPFLTGIDGKSTLIYQ